MVHDEIDADVGETVVIEKCNAVYTIERNLEANLCWPGQDSK